MHCKRGGKDAAPTEDNRKKGNRNEQQTRNRNQGKCRRGAPDETEGPERTEATNGGTDSADRN